MIMPTCNICKYAGRPTYKSPCSECKEFSQYEYEDNRANADAQLVEQAISHFSYGVSHDIFNEPVTTYAKLAIEALEKQIPKKPLHMHKNYYCPICKEDGWMLWDDAVPNDMDEYCGKCGQAIDWR